MREFSGLDTTLVVAMVITLIILIVGLVTMIHGGVFNKKYGSTLMQWRVIAQSIALAIFSLMLLRHR